MVLFEELDREVDNIDWENLGEYIGTAQDDIIIRNNKVGYEVLAIKRIKNQSEHKKYEDLCQQVSFDYCLRIIDKEKITCYSEFYEKDFYCCQRWFSHVSNNLVIGITSYRPDLIDYFTNVEKRAVDAYPLGADCFKLFMENDPSYVFKLREYTRKTLGNTWYRDGDINKGLDSDKLGDIPEDVFMTKLVEVLAGECITPVQLNALPGKVKNYIKYHHLGGQASKRLISYIEQGDENEDSPERELLEKKIAKDYPAQEDKLLDFVLISRIEDIAKVKLSPKELEYFRLLRSGMADVGIAEEKGVSRTTISNRRSSVLDKLRNALTPEND